MFLVRYCGHYWVKEGVDKQKFLLRKIFAITFVYRMYCHFLCRKCWQKVKFFSQWDEKSCDLHEKLGCLLLSAIYNFRRGSAFFSCLVSSQYHQSTSQKFYWGIIAYVTGSLKHKITHYHVDFITKKMYKKSLTGTQIKAWLRKCLLSKTDLQISDPPNFILDWFRVFKR